MPHAPAVETLLESGLAVRAMDPERLDRFTDRFAIAGGKGGRPDRARAR